MKQGFNQDFNPNQSPYYNYNMPTNNNFNPNYNFPNNNYMFPPQQQYYNNPYGGYGNKGNYGQYPNQFGGNYQQKFNNNNNNYYQKQQQQQNPVDEAALMESLKYVSEKYPQLIKLNQSSVGLCENIKSQSNPRFFVIKSFTEEDIHKVKFLPNFLLNYNFSIHFSK